MYNEKYNTIKKLLKGLNVKMLSLTNDETVIKDYDGQRKIELPLTEENLNDKYTLSLINYMDDSISLEIKSTRYTDSLESISYKRDEDIDVMVIKMMNENAIYELCAGKYTNGLQFININRIGINEGKKDEINVSYSHNKDFDQMIATNNGFSIKDSEIKMWLADKENELMEIFKEIASLDHRITNLLISKYRAICEFQTLFNSVKKDPDVIEFLSMKQDKGVQKNILGIKA